MPRPAAANLNALRSPCNLIIGQDATGSRAKGSCRLEFVQRRKNGNAMPPQTLNERGGITVQTFDADTLAQLPGHRLDAALDSGARHASLCSHGVICLALEYQLQHLD
jgi:hypothetical protein